MDPEKDLAGLICRVSTFEVVPATLQEGDGHSFSFPGDCWLQMDLPGYRVSQALNSSLSNSQSIAFAGDIVQNSLLHTATSLFASGVGKELKKTLLVQMRVLSAQLVSVGKDPKIHHDFVWL